MAAIHEYGIITLKGNKADNEKLVDDSVMSGFRVLFNRIVYLGHWNESKEIRATITKRVKALIDQIPSKDLQPFKTHINVFYRKEKVDDVEIAPLKEFSHFALRQVNNEGEAEIAILWSEMLYSV